MTQEDSAVLVAPSPVYLNTTFITSTLASWVVKNTDDSENIRSIYISFGDSKEYSVGKFLQEMALNEDGRKLTFGVCVYLKGGRTEPHIVPLHGLGIGP